MPPCLPVLQSRAMNRWLDSLLRLYGRRSAVISLTLLLTVSFGVWFTAHRIQLNASLEALLPEDTPIRQDVEAMHRRVLRTVPMYLVVNSSDPQLNRRLARRLAKRASSWPESERVLTRRDPSFFLKHRLLYLPEAEIQELEEDIEDRVQWERCQKLPGCVNLEDDAPPLPDEAHLQNLLTDVPEVKSLGAIFGADTVSSFAKTENDPANREQPGVAPPATAEPAGAHRPQLGDLCSEDGAVCTVEVILSGSPRDLAYAQRMTQKAKALLRSVQPPNAPADLRMQVSGAYRSVTKDQASVVGDLGLTTLVSLAVVLLVLLVQFRLGRALLLLTTPLAVSAGLTAIFIALIRPSLNIISAFTLVVLAGVGIDFGVHLITHYGRARKEGLRPGEALTQTLRSLTPPMLTAALTTSCGFLALAAARFPGFSEMGWLAGVGVVFALLSFFFLFPPLLLWAERCVPEKRTLLRTLPTPPPMDNSSLSRGLSWGGFALGTLCLALALGAVGRGVHFEYNFGNLRPKKTEKGISWKSTMHGTAKTAVYMMADTPEVLERAAQAIRTGDLQGLHDPTRHDADGTLPAVITPQSFIPPDQGARLDAIADLRHTVLDAKRHASDALLQKIRSWEPLLNVREPMTLERIPQWASDWLREKNGTVGTLGVIYTNQSGSRADSMEELATALSHWRHRFPGLRLGSPEGLLGEVVPLLRRDAPVIVGLALLGLLFATWVVGRSFKKSLLVLVPTVLAALWTLGIMALFNIKVNMYNMLIFPLAFGVGVDGAIYVVDAFAKGDVRIALRGVAGSTLTTAGAFGAMWVAKNPGVASLATLAVISMGSALVANLLWLPALLRTSRVARSASQIPDEPKPALAR